MWNKNKIIRMSKHNIQKQTEVEMLYLRKSILNNVLKTYSLFNLDL